MVVQRVCDCGFIIAYGKCLYTFGYQNKNMVRCSSDDSRETLRNVANTQETKYKADACIYRLVIIGEI